jgi:hypothetical protein
MAIKIKFRLFILLIIFLFLLFSCTTIKKTDKNENSEYKNVGCLKFLIPSYASYSEKEAKKFRYDFMLVDKNKDYTSSDFIIAIRHKDNLFDYSMESFVKEDLANLQNQVKIFYEGKWSPISLSEKKIKHTSLQFNYFYGNEKIYQRTVYLECGNTFYIISLSTKKFDFVSNVKFDEFWDSISVE